MALFVVAFFCSSLQPLTCCAARTVTTVTDAAAAFRQRPDSSTMERTLVARLTATTQAWAARCSSVGRFMQLRLQQAWRAAAQPNSGSSNNSSSSNGSSSGFLALLHRVRRLVVVVCRAPSSLLPVWSHPWLRPLLLASLYVSLMWAGLALYSEGIGYGNGGSSFGQQIACVAASTACLVAAAATAAATNNHWMTTNTAAAAAATEGTKRQRKSASQSKHEHDEQDDEDYGEGATVASGAFTGSGGGASTRPLLPTSIVHVRASTAVGAGTFSSSSSSSSSSFSSASSSASSSVLLSHWWPWLRMLVLIPLPLVLPWLLSLRAFLGSGVASPSTALSAEINVLLFSAIGAATMTLLAIIYAAVMLRNGTKIVAATAGPVVIGVGLYLVSRSSPSPLLASPATRITAMLTSSTRLFCFVLLRFRPVV